MKMPECLYVPSTMINPANVNVLEMSEQEYERLLVELELHNLPLVTLLASIITITMQA